MLECSDSSFYTGHTSDLSKRLAEHNEGTYCGYTKSRRPVKLVFSCEFQTRDEAFHAERQVKGWSRKKKMALIREDFPAISYLGKKKFEKQAKAAHPE